MVKISSLSWFARDLNHRTRLVPLSVLLLIQLFTPIQAGEITLEIGKHRYHVELATTSGQRQRGLMYREELDADRGMLLVYPRPGDHRVWMKNMHIPLRVYWIDASHRVIHQQRLEPCGLPPCPIFSAPRDSRYILELADRDHGIEIGAPVHGLSGL